MKQITLSILFLIGIFLQLSAQNDGIRFEQGKNWEQILKQAKQENKLVFVDCYASWCGPCKIMTKNIFTLKQVGDYFNSHFISVKLDIEKDTDGRLLARQYQVKALPTLLFVNSGSGEVVQRLMGEQGDQQLVEEAKVAQERFTDPNVWAAYQEELKRTVSFEPELDWDRIVEKARKEGKLIFLVLGNGGEKAIEDLIFVRDSVYNYYNRHFVNVHCDVEKEGSKIHLNKMFPIRNLPTWAFVDPNMQSVVHQQEGAGNTEWFLDLARTANDPQNNLAGLIGRYQDGERDVAFMGRYLSVLVGGNISGQDTIAVEYLGMLSVDELATPENWMYFVKFIADPLTGAFQKVMANRDRFYAFNERSSVDYLLDFAIRSAVSALVDRIPGQPFDEVRNAALIKYLQTIDYPTAPAALAGLYAAAAVRVKDYSGLVQNMRYAFRLNVFRPEEVQTYLARNMKALIGCQNKAVLREAAEVLEEKCQYTATFYGKADVMRMKADLLEQAGDKAGARSCREQEADYRTQGDEAGEW